MLRDFLENEVENSNFVVPDANGLNCSCKS